MPRAHPEEKLLLQSFSRSNEVYQRFSDNLNIAYAGNEEKYTKLTISDVESVIQDIDADITKAKLDVQNTRNSVMVIPNL